jgi:hypothetical protein
MKTLEQQLKKAGFKTVIAVGEKHLHASGAADFGKAHAAFLQAAGNAHAFRWECAPEPVLVVFNDAATVAPDSDPVPVVSNDAATVEPDSDPADIPQSINQEEQQ